MVDTVLHSGSQTLKNLEILENLTSFKFELNLNKGGADLCQLFWIHYMVAILNYYLLPLATTHLVGDNSKFEFLGVLSILEGI